MFYVAVGSGLSNSRKKYNCDCKCREQTTRDHWVFLLVGNESNGRPLNKQLSSDEQMVKMFQENQHLIHQEFTEASSSCKHRAGRIKCGGDCFNRCRKQLGVG